MPADIPERYRAITLRNIDRLPQWRTLAPELRRAVRVVGSVLPFRTNPYVVDRLIDWSRVPDDPIFQLTFGRRGMLAADDFDRLDALIDDDDQGYRLQAIIAEIRRGMNPHPAHQTTLNVPRLDGRALQGLQHKYRETVLFFPSAGQTCHAYCTFCFRWPQFVGDGEHKMQGRETTDLRAYLARHREVTDLLITGGDPMIMKTRLLRRYLDPVLGDPALEHLQTVRFGTKSMAYWPQRFVTDDDADDLLRCLEAIVESGRHVAIMGHYSHPVELETTIARRAVRRIRSTGAEIRMQSPLIRRVNDRADIWADMWRQGVRLGCIPYYMFVERDTGPKRYFEVPLARSWDIFRQAYGAVSGLSRTVRGPSMSASPGKVLVDGVAEIRGEKVFVLQFLQARRPEWVRRPFFARFDPAATWLDDLRPAFGEDRFFFQKDPGVPSEADLLTDPARAVDLPA